MSKYRVNELENLAGTKTVKVEDIVGLLKSPDGSEWIIQVDNSGNLTAVKK